MSIFAQIVATQIFGIWISVSIRFAIIIIFTSNYIDRIIFRSP